MKRKGRHKIEIYQGCRKIREGKRKILQCLSAILATAVQHSCTGTTGAGPYRNPCANLFLPAWAGQNNTRTGTTVAAGHIDRTAGCYICVYMVLRQNVRRHKVQGQNKRRDKISVGTKHPDGQTVRQTKHPWGQNV